MEQKKLAQDLKNGILQMVYLLYGTERYLMQHYTKEIEKAALGGIGEADIFDEKSPANEIVMAAESLPFFQDRRFIIVKESKLFATGRKNESEIMAKYLHSVPDQTVIVFVESDVDRRSKLFKQISKVGCVVECQQQTPQMLATWVMRLAKEKGASMTALVAGQFVRIVGNNMSQLYQETAKLAAYTGGKEITVDDIHQICTPTLESRIFDLIKAMGSGKAADALARYRDMLILKESPLMILSMIIRQFRIILISKCAKEKGMTIFQTAKDFNLRDFMVSEALDQGRKYTVSALVDALNDCMDTDVKIKTGLISAEFGVELLIVRYGM